MRNELEKQLENLNVELIRMGALCEKVIAGTTKALFNGDAKYTAKSHAVEEEIDKSEHKIEHICMSLLLKQQPVASDFRFISAALKMISDLERIGDQCADIADMIRFTAPHDLKDFKDLEKMSSAAKEMLTNAIESYVKKDKDLAISVMQSDDVVDSLFDSVKKRLIKEIEKNANEGELFIDIIMIAKYYERIGDHATNVAEWVYYSITGEHI